MTPKQRRCLRHVLVVTIWIGLCAGCGHAPCPECPIPLRQVEADSACPDWRWIGIKEGSSAERGRHEPTEPSGDGQGYHRIPPYRLDQPCPELAGWHVRHLFADPDSPAATLPLGLRRYCLYEHPDAGADLSGPAIPGLAEIGRDCMGVVPQGSALGREYAPVLEPHVLSQAGRPATWPATAAPPVRLAVVDTSPTDAEAPERRPASSPHGLSLANLAAKLLCRSDGSCVAEATSQLALAYVSFNPRSARLSVRDEVRGGFVGTIGELAEAIRKEVVAWRAAAPAGQGLVLNLSVGWDGDLFGGGPGAPPPVQAVQSALEDAVCRGALAVAAAGNQDWGPDPHAGPLFPAAWEGAAAPTAARCDVELLPPGGPSPLPPPDPASYRPLVFAAGGVTAADRPLVNARFAATPRLVAFADHAVVDTPPSGPPTSTLTGTSVASLVVAAAAAGAWHYGASSDDPFSAIEAVDRSAVELARPLDVDFELADPRAGGRGRARRASVCRAAAAACRGTPCPTCSPPMAIDRGELLAALDRAFPQATRTVSIQGRGRAVPRNDCPPAAARRLGRPPEIPRPRTGARSTPYPCPRWQLPDLAARAWVKPQPGSNPSPACLYDVSSNTLYIEVDDTFANAIAAPTLLINAQSYPLDLSPAAGGQALVQGIDADADDTLSVSAIIDGGQSTTSPVLIVP